MKKDIILYTKKHLFTITTSTILMGMEVTYKTKGTCARSITFTKNDDGTITNISFEGGCDGNLKAISKLCNGMKAEEIIAKLKGNTCGYKSTSCADQLAKAVEQA